MRNLLALATLFLLFVSVNAAEKSDVALSVFNFRMKSGPATWQWMEKGIADRLITDITLSGKTQPVQRDIMQSRMKFTGHPN